VRLSNREKCRREIFSSAGTRCRVGKTAEEKRVLGKPKRETGGGIAAECYYTLEHLMNRLRGRIRSGQKLKKTLRGPGSGLHYC